MSAAIRFRPQIQGRPRSQPATDQDIDYVARTIVEQLQRLNWLIQGIPDFKLLIRKRRYASAQFYAFDLLEVDGEDLRGEPIEARKRVLTQLLGTTAPDFSSANQQLTSRSSTSARWAWKASCQRNLAQDTSLAARLYGLKCPIPTAPALQRLEQENWRR
jgi:ATP dependent DNA ligase domain